MLITLEPKRYGASRKKWLLVRPFEEAGRLCDHDEHTWCCSASML